MSKRYGIAYLFTAEVGPSSTSVTHVLVIATLVVMLVIIIVIIAVIIWWQRGLCASKYSVPWEYFLLCFRQLAHDTPQA